MAIIGGGELDLGDIANLDVLIALLVDGGCATDADATDADATDADATDADATDADATDADATDADATDADATDADATDADATDADATDADTTDTDATDADATDSTDGDSTDADAADADATDADATDADASDADATDADATDADGNDGTEEPTGSVSAYVYECATVGDISLEYKNSSDAAAGTSGCEPGTATLTFTSVETGETFVLITGAGVSGSAISMPVMQLASPMTTTVINTAVVELPAGMYDVALDGTDVSLAIEVEEGTSNPSLVVSVLAPSQVDPAPTSTVAAGETTDKTPTPGVTGLPSTGTGLGASDFLWPIAAAGSVLVLLAGHFALSSLKRRKN